MDHPEMVGHCRVCAQELAWLRRRVRELEGGALISCIAIHAQAREDLDQGLPPQDFREVYLSAYCDALIDREEVPPMTGDGTQPPQPGELVSHTQQTWTVDDLRRWLAHFPGEQTVYLEMGAPGAPRAGLYGIAQIDDGEGAPRVLVLRPMMPRR
jgi:hypothetical protein